MSANGSAELPISKELLEILRCPQAVQEPKKYGNDPGRLDLVHNSWLVSADSGLKYPIRDGIPIMLIDEGLRWKGTETKDLPVPPPAAESADNSTTSTSSVSNQAGASGGVSPVVIIGVLAALIALLLMLRKKS